MNFVAGLFGLEDPAIAYILLAPLVLLTLPILCSNFTSLLIVVVVTSPLLLDFVIMLGSLPIEGDRHGYTSIMQIALLFPTPCTFLTRIVGLMMQRRGWSRQKAIVFDVAGVFLFVLSAYLYREFGNINPVSIIN